LPSKQGIYVKGRIDGEGMHSALRGLPEMNGQQISLYPVNTIEQARPILAASVRKKA
jgi:hypothetical protein